MSVKEPRIGHNSCAAGPAEYTRTAHRRGREAAAMNSAVDRYLNGDRQNWFAGAPAPYRAAPEWCFSQNAMYLKPTILWRGAREARRYSVRGPPAR